MTQAACHLPGGQQRRLAIAAVLLIISSQVSGQESRVDLNSIDEIIVTAQKRAQPLRQVAAAVTVLNGKFIENAGIEDVSNLGLFTPGMVVSTNGTSGRIYIRGVGNNLDFLGSQGAVAVHIDGVYESRSWGAFYDFIDVERIEILRGPQGTLYGRNATGGAINVISGAPTEDLTARAAVSVGNFADINLKGTLSSALSDTILGRISVTTKSRDGFTDNLEPGFDELDDEDLLTARGELQFSPSDSFNVRLLGRYLSRDTEGLAIVPTADGLAASLGAESNIDPFAVRHNTDTFFEAENWGLTATATWKTNENVTLESITAFGDNTVNYHLDTDGTEIDAVHFANREDHKQLSQELRLFSQAENSAWTWQAGLFYLAEETSDSGIVFLPAFGFDIPVAGTVEVDAVAVFAQGTYQFANEFGLTLGIRYNGETKTMISPVFVDDESSWHDWTPHISLEYRMNDDSFFYASITKGFKSGGYNVLGGGERVDPEYVWSYELGSKTQWLDDRVALNAAIFYSRYDDQQVNTFTGAGLAVIDNAAKSTIYGIELEAFAAPTPRIDIGVAISYLDAEFDQYLAADPFLGGVDLAGSRLSNAPEYSFAITGNYTWPLRSQAAVTMQLDYLWQDEIKYDVFDNDATNQAAYGIANAGIWYAAPERSWRMGLWIRNIADKTYFISHAKLNFTPDGIVSFAGEPRTYGLEVSFEY